MAASIEKKLIISTDSLGLFGNVANLEVAWGFLKGTACFDGVELLAFSSVFHDPLDLTIKRMQETGFRISGIHGRIGAYLKSPLEIIRRRSLNPLKAPLLNEMLMNTGVLIGRFALGVDYLLFHESELNIGDNFKVIAGYQDDQQTFFIENNYTPDRRGVSKAVESVKQLKDLGVNAKFMFDLYHAARSPYYQSPHIIWKSAIDCLAEVRLSSDDLLGGVHIPLGLRLDDSLPFEAVKGEVQIWQDLAGVLNDGEGVIRRVLENQQAGLRNQLMPSYASLVAQRERNQAIYYDFFTRFEVI